MICFVYAKTVAKQTQESMKGLEKKKKRSN